MSHKDLGLDLDRLASETYSAVYSDVCDAAGLRQQTLDPGATLLAGPKGVLVGWARTAVSRPVTDIPARPYGGEIDFIDSLGVGDVVVLDCSRKPAAAWGELFSTASVGRGARGALIDGLIRDVDKIDELGRFPVFGRGTRPTDSLGRVAIAEYDVPVCVYGLTVYPGDLVVCDSDGVTMVPSDRAPEIIQKAREKASTENSARKLLLDGGLLRDVWEKYRVL
jgi:regulator of RNase E activity RraA